MALRRVLSPGFGAANGTTWTDAYASVDAVGSPANGDIILVHKTHAFNKGAAITWMLGTGAGVVAVLCVDKDAADALSTGASEQTGGNFAFTIQCPNLASAGFYVHGMAIKAGATGAAGNDATADVHILSTAASPVSGKGTIESCSIWGNSTNAGAGKVLGSTSTTVMTDLTVNNTSFRFEATNQTISIAGRNTLFNCWVDAAGATPGSLFTPTGPGNTKCFGCDWRKCSAVVNQSAAAAVEFLAANCLTPSVTGPITGTHPGMAGGSYTFFACGPVDAVNGPGVFNYYRSEGLGTVQVDRTNFYTTDPSQATSHDGTASSYSWKLTPAAAVSRFVPLYTPWIPIELVTSGDKTFTVKVADTETAALKDTDIWVEQMVMGTNNVADSTQSVYLTGAPHVPATQARDAYIAGSDLTDTGEAWTALAETHAYDVACGPYAADYAGYAYIRFAVGKATANPVYVDGKLRIT